MKGGSVHPGESDRSRNAAFGTSLVPRIAASTALLAATVVVLVVAFFVAVHGDFVSDVFETTLRGISLTLAERIWEEPERAQAIARRHSLGVVVSNPDGRSPQQTLAFGPDGEPIDAEAELAGPRFRRVEAAGPDGRRIVFFWDMLFFARAHLPLLIGLVVALLSMIGATYAFQLSQLRPLQWLRVGVEAVSEGDFTTRVPVVRPDEIGSVAQAFNQMTRRVERMLSDRERLLADVSHELRSPMARIRVALELLPESDKRDAIARDVREMETLTAGLLEREQVRRRMDDHESESVDVAALLRAVVAGFAGRAPGVVYAGPAGDVEIRGDAVLIKVLLQNLVDNAVKFSGADSRAVEVSLRPAGELVEIAVDDDGCGIPDHEVERVFEPFVKLDPARGHLSGYGLGLDLCRRIVEAHRGDIEIAASDGRGTRVRVRLPAA